MNHSCLLPIALEMGVHLEYELEKKAKKMGGSWKQKLSWLRNKILTNTFVEDDTVEETHWYQKILSCHRKQTIQSKANLIAALVTELSKENVDWSCKLLIKTKGTISEMKTWEDHVRIHTWICPMWGSEYLGILADGLGSKAL